GQHLRAAPAARRPRVVPRLARARAPAPRAALRAALRRRRQRQPRLPGLAAGTGPHGAAAAPARRGAGAAPPDPAADPRGRARAGHARTVLTWSDLFRAAPAWQARRS